MKWTPYQQTATSWNNASQGGSTIFIDNKIPNLDILMDDSDYKLDDSIGTLSDLKDSPNAPSKVVWL